MSAEELVTMLNEKTVRFDVGQGGIPSLTWDMVDAALCKCSKGAYALARAIHCGDREDGVTLLHATTGRAEIMSKDSGWSWNEKAQLGISRVACFLILNPGRCTWCKGTKYNAHQKPCVPCSGSGMAKPPSLRKLAEIADLEPEAYRRTWHDRAMKLLYEVQVWEGEVGAVLRRELYG